MRRSSRRGPRQCSGTGDCVPSSQVEEDCNYDRSFQRARRRWRKWFKGKEGALLLVGRGGQPKKEEANKNSKDIRAAVAGGRLR